MTTRLTNKETKLDEVNILEEFNASLIMQNEGL